VLRVGPILSLATSRQKFDLQNFMTSAKALRFTSMIDASVYNAQTHDQASYFVKLKRGHHHFMWMFEPNGVVDIAFKTDESLTGKSFP
jgi:hypothetical protein